MYPTFNDDIAKMNTTYELRPLDHTDPNAVAGRLMQFKEILDKEFTELIDIQNFNDAPPYGDMERLARVRVDMADLLGDIIVYCASEAHRWNIPLGTVLSHAIMPSNFSKLGADGKPIKDANDKFQKGPNYWKPEPKIAQLLVAWDAFQAGVTPEFSTPPVPGTTKGE